MKKLLVSTGLVAALTLSPVLTSAQTLTRADVVAMIPQLTDLSLALGNAVRYIELKTANDNALLGQHVLALRVASTRLSTASTSPLTSLEMESIRNVILQAETQASTTIMWRATVASTTASIVNVLSNITRIISSAIGNTIVTTNTTTNTSTSNTTVTGSGSTNYSPSY